MRYRQVEEMEASPQDATVPVFDELEPEMVIDVTSDLTPTVSVDGEVGPHNSASDEVNHLSVSQSV